MSVIGILTTILSGVELAAKIGEVAQKIIPDAPKDLKDKYRWIQCTVKNETQFDLLLEGTYFDSGRYWTAPGSIGNFDQLVFSCCNGDNSILTGVSGGNALRLSLDSEHYYDFALGWTNPTAGAFKAGVVESNSAKEGYEKASETGGSIMSSSVFVGKDKDGKEAKFKIHISAAPGPATLYVVKQILVA